MGGWENKDDEIIFYYILYDLKIFYLSTFPYYTNTIVQTLLSHQIN